MDATLKTRKKYIFPGQMVILIPILNMTYCHIQDISKKES
jgi:hypothetical protein